MRKNCRNGAFSTREREWQDFVTVFWGSFLLASFAFLFWFLGFCIGWGMGG
jgi:hypothetical protein